MKPDVETDDIQPWHETQQGKALITRPLLPESFRQPVENAQKSYQTLNFQLQALSAPIPQPNVTISPAQVNTIRFTPELGNMPFRDIAGLSDEGLNQLAQAFRFARIRKNSLNRFTRKQTAIIAAMAQIPKNSDFADGFKREISAHGDRLPSGFMPCVLRLSKIIFEAHKARFPNGRGYQAWLTDEIQNKLILLDWYACDSGIRGFVKALINPSDNCHVS